jgi:cysteine desulfurase
MGLPEDTARGALRFSLGYHTTARDIEAVVSVFAGVVEQARQAGMASGHSRSGN